MSALKDLFTVDHELLWEAMICPRRETWLLASDVRYTWYATGAGAPKFSEGISFEAFEKRYMSIIHQPAATFRENKQKMQYTRTSHLLSLPLFYISLLPNSDPG